MEKDYIQLNQWNTLELENILNWKSHVNAIATKLNQTNVMLYKVRNFVNANILKSIYYALFESDFNYDCIIWGRNISPMNLLFTLQKKPLRIINFKECNSYLSPLFHYSKIIKITDKFKIENCLFINKYTSWSTFSLMAHNYQTSFASEWNMEKTSNGKNTFTYLAIRNWNDIQKKMKGMMLKTFSVVKLRLLLVEF